MDTARFDYSSQANTTAKEREGGREGGEKKILKNRAEMNAVDDCATFAFRKNSLLIFRCCCVDGGRLAGKPTAPLNRQRCSLSPAAQKAAAAAEAAAAAAAVAAAAQPSFPRHLMVIVW